MAAIRVGRGNLPGIMHEFGADVADIGVLISLYLAPGLVITLMVEK